MNYERQLQALYDQINNQFYLWTRSDFPNTFITQGNQTDYMSSSRISFCYFMWLLFKEIVIIGRKPWADAHQWVLIMQLYVCHSHTHMSTCVHVWIVCGLVLQWVLIIMVEWRVHDLAQGRSCSGFKVFCLPNQYSAIVLLCAKAEPAHNSTLVPEIIYYRPSSLKQEFRTIDHTFVTPPWEAAKRSGEVERLQPSRK